MLFRIQRTTSSAAFLDAAVCVKILIIVCLFSTDVFSADAGSENSEEKAAEKAELKAQRPEEWRGPTIINFFVS